MMIKDLLLFCPSVLIQRKKKLLMKRNEKRRTLSDFTMEKQFTDDHLKIQHHAIEFSTMANSIEYGTCARTFNSGGFGRSSGMLMNRKICALTNTYCCLDEYSWKNFIKKRIRTTTTNTKTIAFRKVTKRNKTNDSM